jgi:hypothetical protein
MYRGHIIAQYKNVFDIADIYGDRREGQDFLDTLYQDYGDYPPKYARFNNCRLVPLDFHVQFLIIVHFHSRARKLHWHFFFIRSRLWSLFPEFNENPLSQLSFPNNAKILANPAAKAVTGNDERITQHFKDNLWFPRWSSAPRLIWRDMIHVIVQKRDMWHVIWRNIIGPFDKSQTILRMR